MNTRTIATLGAILLGGQLTYADASYQETTQITGGTLVNQIKSLRFLGSRMSDLFAPTTTTTMVHGNQKAVLTKDSIEITDLDKEEIIHIDNAHKTYSVMTFDQMRQAIASMPQQLDQAQAKIKQAQEQAQTQPQAKPNLQTSFEVSAQNTGVTKPVNGLVAQEQIVTMKMHVTNLDAPPSAGGNTVTYVVTADTWIAPDPPEVKEIQDFDVRMGKKLMAGVDLAALRAQMSQSAAGMSQLFSSQPGSGEAMAQMQKEVAKLKGTRVLEVTQMGGVAPASPQSTAQGAGQGSGQGSGQGDGAGSVAGQVASDTAAQTAASEASRLGVFGSALGSSALGAFHRKKPAAQQQPAETAPAQTAASGSAAGAPGSSNVVLMETTSQKSNFSQEPVPISAFQVPVGFTKIASPMQKASQ